MLPLIAESNGNRWADAMCLELCQPIEDEPWGFCEDCGHETLATELMRNDGYCDHCATKDAT